VFSSFRVLPTGLAPHGGQRALRHLVSEAPAHRHAPRLRWMLELTVAAFRADQNPPVRLKPANHFPKPSPHTGAATSRAARRPAITVFNKFRACDCGNVVYMDGAIRSFSSSAASDRTPPNLVSTRIFPPFGARVNPCCSNTWIPAGILEPSIGPDDRTTVTPRLGRRCHLAVAVAPALDARPAMTTRREGQLWITPVARRGLKRQRVRGRFGTARGQPSACARWRRRSSTSESSS
jgi:hypothetical protein